MERKYAMRRQDNFQGLVNNKRIIIPIIQRDYAQGRNDPKAISVRMRLIDEWIDILQDLNLRMDFNYIYGNEAGDTFFPVDGQQRLTSLFLLHWYLAMATNHTDVIGQWQFDYKTRNSASEFFAFLRNAEKAKTLFAILYSNKSEEDKQESIRNENWFKTKWENDPTVVACVNFLCMLSEKLSDYKDRFDAFWTRLNDTDSPAVYFTCLNECDDEYAELDAAKKYTRMNARGKRLTNFENLKAMIDEIEMKYIKELAYCTDDEQEALSDTISWTYDRLYIDCLFDSMHERSLIEKTKSINDESEKWFRLVYYVYVLVNKREIPCDLGIDTNNANATYDDAIYKISQERVNDDKILEYLYMLKAMFEVLCNSGDGLAFKYHEYRINSEETRRYAIALILFVSKMWKRQNKKSDNAIIIEKWNGFRSALIDLNYLHWNVRGDYEYATIIGRMVSDIHTSALGDIDKYFVTNDFDKSSSFDSLELVPDYKCRILERKVKSKLIIDGAISERVLNEVDIENRRWGYLFYVCGFLSDWSLGDWSKKAKWDGTELNSYIELIRNKDSFEKRMRTRDAKVIFAYASQYDPTSRSLLCSNEINKCNNEHIWKHAYLDWDDAEYENINEEKQKMLKHLKVMFDLLLSFKTKGEALNEDLFEKYVDEINTIFDANTGYEECWLRLAAKFPSGGKDLLDSELENKEEIVVIKSVPVTIRTYLVEKGYHYKEKISELQELNKKSNYFTADENKILYASTDKTCTFAPDPDNSGKYQHSQKTTWGWDLSGNIVNRNMDLRYKAYFDFSGIGKAIKNNFWSIDIDGGVYTIKVYELGGLNNGKVIINISEANIDVHSISLIKDNIKQWERRFDEIEKDPKKNGNFDRWIELWNDEYQAAFGTSSVQGAVNYDRHGGQRPKKVWSEVFPVSALTWRLSRVEM